MFLSNLKSFSRTSQTVCSHSEYFSNTRYEAFDMNRVKCIEIHDFCEFCQVILFYYTLRSTNKLHLMVSLSSVSCRKLRPSLRLVSPAEWSLYCCAVCSQTQLSLSPYTHTQASSSVTSRDKPPASLV